MQTSLPQQRHFVCSPQKRVGSSPGSCLNITGILEGGRREISTSQPTCPVCLVYSLAHTLLCIVINSLKDRESVFGGMGVSVFLWLFSFPIPFLHLSQVAFELTSSCFSGVCPNHQTMGTIHHLPHKADPHTAKNV